MDRTSFPFPGQRIVVVGATGTGKTTLAAALAQIIGAPHVELDSLYWQAGWQAVPREVFCERLRLVVAGPTWVVDGNYSFARSLTWHNADTLVWLDYPWWLNFHRLWQRSLRRLFRHEVLWNDNHELLKNLFFSPEPLFLYMFKSRRKQQRSYPAALLDPQFSHLVLVHLTGPRQAETWLACVRQEYDTVLDKHKAVL